MDNYYVCIDSRVLLLFACCGLGIILLIGLCLWIFEDIIPYFKKKRNPEKYEPKRVVLARKIKQELMFSDKDLFDLCFDDFRSAFWTQERLELLKDYACTQMVVLEEDDENKKQWTSLYAMCIAELIVRKKNSNDL